MDILNNGYIKFKNKDIKIQKNKKEIRIINETDTRGFIVFTRVVSLKNDKKLSLKFDGNIIKGTGAKLLVFNFKRNVMGEAFMNSEATCLIKNCRFFFAVQIDKKSEVLIKNIEANFLDDNQLQSGMEFKNVFENENDILIITPSYPTEENKYFGGFVHSRVKAYKEAGLKFDLVCAHNYLNTCRYSFEGVEVTRTDFNGLRNILTNKKYKTILVHFFDDKYAQIFDACDISESNLYFWVHGPETLYWDWVKMTGPYFVQESVISNESHLYFERLDRIVKRYNSYNNVKWVFVSEWIKKHSEELINIEFENSIVIPNFIDSTNFKYEKKDVGLRKKIFILRRFENISKYAIDIDVRTILELSRRDFFDDLEFNIYGQGAYYKTLMEPLKNFSNVHLYQNFLSHKDIAEVHKKNGIALFATRYDAQGVSMCEAAMSGLAIVSSNNDAIAEFLPYEEKILCETEDYTAYADIIERMYKEPEYFQRVSKCCHDKVYEKCCFEQTVEREIAMIRSAEEYYENNSVVNYGEKILSIIVPAYNVALYLFHGVETMLKHENAGKIEVIIVNDGSKDNTVEVAKKLQKKYSDDIIKIIDKENGGHGSTINEGVKIARGKYVRIIDGDDWVDSVEMGKLIDILSSETSDIVITDYSEDRAPENSLITRKLYQFMRPGKIYKFDDLCFDGYGFGEFGPVLATGNFKRQILQNKFKLTENCFYIDMEFDAYSIVNADTVVYYPLDIYRYFIGRSDQSISENSFKRNYKQHEKVIFNLIKIYMTAKVSDEKKRYILNKLIVPMINSHYIILIQYWKSRKKYNEFETELKRYPEIFYNSNIVTKMRKIHRKTKGILVRYDSTIKRMRALVKK